MPCPPPQSTRRPEESGRKGDARMNSVPRREFLSRCTGAAAILATAGTLAIRTSSASRIDQLGVSVVGVRGVGRGHVERLLTRDDVRITAICDIDQAVAERAGQMVKRAKGHNAQARGKLPGPTRGCA